MRRMRFQALLWFLWVLAAKASRRNASTTLEAECHEGDVQDLLQVSEGPKHPIVVDVVGSGSEVWPRKTQEENEDLIMVGKKETCERIEWPCGDSVACRWPLQQINRGGNCKEGKGTAYVSSLNLEDGSYKDLCKFPGICLNACSISRPESAIYCRALGARDKFYGRQQFVRLSCPLTDFKEAVNGTVCYFGEIGSTYAASFDENDGTFYWKTSGGQINVLNATAISDLVESTVPLVEELSSPNWDQVRKATIPGIKDSALNSVADFVIEQGDRIPEEARIQGGNPPEDRYLVACQENYVYLANVKPGMTGKTPEEGGPIRYTMDVTNENPPGGQSGAQWFFRGDIYCAYNKKDFGVYKVNVSEIDVAEKVIPTSFIQDSAETSSNDGLNCLNVTSPFPPPPPATTSTTSTSTTTTTSTTIPKVRCSNGQGDWQLDNAAVGSLEVGKEIVPGVTLVEFSSGGNEDCTNAAIFSQENGGDGAEEQNLKKCVCNLLIAQNNASVSVQDKVYVCSPAEGTQAQLVLEFDDPQKIKGLQMWNTYSGITEFRWINENQMEPGTVTIPPSAEGAGTGFVDISTVQPLATKVKKVVISFGGPAGLKSIRFCKQQGSIVGDPHVHTLDGKTYILLQQGTFLMWRLSGLETEFPSANLEGLHKAQVDWQIFTHYSGNKSFTKGLLILDKSQKQDRQAIEVTSDDCSWRKRRSPKEDWSRLDGPQMLSMPEEDFVTGFNVVWHSQDTKLRKHVRFVMNTKHGVRSIATLHVSCQPGHHINARVEMDQLGYTHFIQGEVGRARAKPLGTLPELRGHLVDSGHQADLLLNGADGAISAESRDEEFHSKLHWRDLGGSSAGSKYLKAVDEEGMASVTPCLPTDEHRAEKICTKHFGGPENDFFSDCVFDVCAGGGEVSAQLLAAIV